MDIEVQILCIIIIYWHMRRVQPMHSPRNKDNTSILSGHAYTLELLSGNNRQCIELMRMSREAYVRLCIHFRQRLWLQDSRHVSVEEKMTMFLTTIGHNERYTVIKRRFQHSTQTVHKYFHEVLNAMMQFAREMIVPTTFDPNPDIPGSYKMLRRIFKGAVGALDGTLVHAVIPTDQQTVYRGRGKGKCYQNVLEICDFNMVFTFVWAGWEGVAHDSRVLTEIIAEPSNGFPFPPPNKYYLCDAAYTNTQGFMVPYRNVRYWLGDFRRRRAKTKEEKFNHAHAKLRNVIERSYGVLKRRFPILDKMAPFPFNVQRDVVIACFAVNNFIRNEKIDDELFAEYDQPQMEFEQEGEEEWVEDGTTGSHWGAENLQFMGTMREKIALQLMENMGGAD